MSTGSHSSTVKMSLRVDGMEPVDIRQMADSFLIVGPHQECAPCVAEISMSVDGSSSSWKVWLVDGMHLDSQIVMIGPWTANKDDGRSTGDLF